MQEAKLPPSAEVDRLTDLMVDPANGLYRYRVAKLILPLALKTPVTPNQITWFHMALGPVSAYFVARGSTRDLVTAVAISECRMILDCLDGLVARARGTSSSYGRALDEIADTVAYVGFLYGMGFFLHARRPDLPWWLLFLVMPVVLFFCGFFMAGGWDFYKRKYTVALRQGKDAIYDEIYPKHMRMKQGFPGFVNWWAYYVDVAQMFVIHPLSRHEFYKRLDSGEPPGLGSPEVDHIIRNYKSPMCRAALRSIGFMSGDNLFTILHIGFLTGWIWGTQMFIIAYAILAIAVTMFLNKTFLGLSRPTGHAFDRAQRVEGAPVESRQLP
jgi:phosphatidylglycerophosphate synthase